MDEPTDISMNTEDDMAEHRPLWRLGMDRLLSAVQTLMIMIMIIIIIIIIIIMSLPIKLNVLGSILNSAAGFFSIAGLLHDVYRMGVCV